ncbi:MAG: Trm112 family protein [Pseudomonadota bacterium]|nr:Trm112 family protein [Pseudomonadota bacterium]
MFDESLLDIIVCPVTKEKLTLDKKTNELISKKAKLAFPIREGIPILLIEEARKLIVFKR